eukprot:TRINITY_DN8094_c0_g1_i1.p1 TRINITY_DN8094_c0_g1~~TRINITY_DN8094_c0_g1_i1.p1  ORF type:complete len:797 (+),score=253.18 TRINITY_DN8094_c0_g1_i1:114-2504(+)
MNRIGRYVKLGMRKRGGISKGRFYAMGRGAIVGIDLGTTNSCVAIMEGTNPRVIENSDGVRTTPSIVAYSIDEAGEKQKLVGQAAKRQSAMNPENTFYATKRLLGRSFNDPLVKKEQELVPYKIIEGNAGMAWLQDKEGQKYAPTDISASILSKMKETAEGFLGRPVDRAVVTVPAYFNEAQRQATKLAGEIAGLKVDRMINEPTAAALAYGLNLNQGETCAVYDLGGGTFDVSILSFADNVFEVRATNGDTFLGGEDFDAVLLRYLLAEFKKQNKGFELKNDNFALQRIREAAEKAKCELSTSLQTDVNLPFLTADATGPKHLNTRLTRSQLEKLVLDIIKKTIPPCERCLSDSGLNVEEITTVVLVGGMTKMPRVQQTVQEFFGKAPNKTVNPDEAVAIGAAIQAGVVTGALGDTVLLDVTPLNLSVEVFGGLITLIPANTTLPARKSRVLTTEDNGQTEVDVCVLQGNEPTVEQNKILTEFVLGGIKSAPAGVPQIEVMFDIDSDGILAVSAKDLKNGNEEFTIVHTAGELSEEEVAKMKEEIIQQREIDKKLQEELIEKAKALEAEEKKEEEEVGMEVMETKEFVFFWYGWPGRHEPCDFADDKFVRYWSVQQYYLAEKARSVEDYPRVKQIMRSTDEDKLRKVQKEMKLARKDMSWGEEIDRDIMRRGNEMKFRQNEKLRGRLLATGEKTLVEASPFDKDWGIGMAANDIRVEDKKRWKGKNWMGESLMSVREVLRNEDATEAVREAAAAEQAVQTKEETEQEQEEEKEIEEEEAENSEKKEEDNNNTNKK